MNHFTDFLLRNRKERNLRLFLDIETLQYNIDRAEDEKNPSPSEYKNVPYSVAISYYDEEDLEITLFPNFKSFFDTITATYAKWKNNPRFELIIHNGNKYDNHFLEHDLKYYYDLPTENIYLKNATDKGNILTTKKTGLTKTQKVQGVILEKRIKSANNLELVFYLNNIEFFTTDNYMKTNVSLETLGTKLLTLGYIQPDELKTDFNYTKYHKGYDMTEDEAHAYALKVYNQLEPDELTYIRNDVIILGKSVKYYSELFKGFDYSKITFTSNILEFYNDNDLTSFQLLSTVCEGKDKTHIKYTDYRFGTETFYDYLKPFYRGGLNFYNQIYLNKIINEPVFTMDLNSSYPYAMHAFKIPTYLKEYKHYTKETPIPISWNEDTYFMYRITKDTFDNHILSKINSRVVRQMLIKYYTTNEYININSYTIKLIETVTGETFDTLPVLSWLAYDCIDFGSKDKIAENYFIKTQGKQANKIIYNSPYDITLTDEINEHPFTPEEYDNSKVLLNGLYGIPALRPFFNLFRLIGHDLQNIANGYVNNERNIVFSIFVTSVALYNLLEPLKHLTADEIDENFLYCDTDSLYFKQTIMHKMPKEMFHDMHLGAWGLDSDTISQFCVINHKKYAYVDWNKKTKKDEINVASAGIPHASFDTKMPFEKFIETQFSTGVQIKNLKSIRNKQGTISLYDSTTELKAGSGYRLFAKDERIDKMKEQMFEDIRNETQGETDDIIYIESALGSFSVSDVWYQKREVAEKKPLLFLQQIQQQIRERI